MPKTDERDNIQRDVLPIPDHKPVALTTYTAKDPDTRFPPIRVLRPPAFAPNVLVVLIDDAGFGSSSAFGGPCQTPTAERLAKAGLKYTRFHTTALCSPTRRDALRDPATAKEVWVAVHTKKDAGRLGNRILREAGIQ
jgi:arylsulfatase